MREEGDGEEERREDMERKNNIDNLYQRFTMSQVY